MFCSGWLLGLVSRNWLEICTCHSHLFASGARFRARLCWPFSKPGSKNGGRCGACEARFRFLSTDQVPPARAAMVLVANGGTFL